MVCTSLIIEDYRVNIPITHMVPQFKDPIIGHLEEIPRTENSSTDIRPKG